MPYMKAARSQNVNIWALAGTLQRVNDLFCSELSNIVYHHLYFLQATSVLRTILLSRFIYPRGS